MKIWKTVKQDSGKIRLQHLQQRAEEHASKMNTTGATALKAILRTEQTKQTYKQIKTIMGHKTDKTPLTQIEIQSTANDGTRTTLTTKEELEEAIMKHNQRHSRQSLQTPFANIPELFEAVDPNNPHNKIAPLLDGTYVDQHLKQNIPEIEQEWIRELETRIHSSINETIDIKDFISFFKKRKEQTASSSSGRHMGHYKVKRERKLHRKFTHHPALRS